jgi:hypothetical protein
MNLVLRIPSDCSMSMNMCQYSCPLHIVQNYSIPLLKVVQHLLQQWTVEVFRFYIYCIKNSCVQSIFLSSNAEATRLCGLQISANNISFAKIKSVLHLGCLRLLDIKGIKISTKKLAVGVKGLSIVNAIKWVVPVQFCRMLPILFMCSRTQVTVFSWSHEQSLWYKTSSFLLFWNVSVFLVVFVVPDS